MDNMDRNNKEFVDKTVLNTPKPTACSTVDRRSLQRKKHTFLDQISSVDLENSLGLQYLPEADLSNISKLSHNSSANTSYHLQQQRELANSSLQRANKVTGLPSRYLKPNVNISSLSDLNLTTESTISESDLLKTPKDTSTPRTSVTSDNCEESKQMPLGLGKSMAELSYKIGSTDISMDNFVKEFQKAMKSLNKGASEDSNVFKPAEEAASMLLADELSWRRQNDIPVANNFSQVTNADVSLGKVSVGAFFQQRSDTLSDFKAAVSPEKKPKPTPLIDSSRDSLVSFVGETEENKNQNKRKSNKSLSISAIQKFLAQTEDTPRKVTDYLLSQGNKSDEKVHDNSSLPVSKDSSYTSNYSDNDIMKCIVADKENIDTHNIQCNQQQVISEPQNPSLKPENRPLSSSSSRGSSRTSSSLTSLPNGKLPIESTRAELIWGCVKVDKCVTQDFLLRNRTPRRLCLQMSISGHEFKIRKDSRQESDPLSAAKIMLHPHESRPIIISFIPTKIGAAVDEIAFTSLDPNLQQTKKQCVRLFGYGGYGKIELYNLTKDTTGKFWMSLGKLDDRNTITKTFLIRNTGTLPSFAYISFNSKELYAFANITVTPSFLVLIPNEEKEVVVTYNPTLEDHKTSHLLFTNTLVADIGTLLVISGTEVNRGRLRRLCRKCMEKDLTVDPISNILKETIKNEVMPADLVMFKESPSSLKEFLKLFTRNEIALTLEQDPEQTIIPQYPDESAMFQSLCQDSTVVCLENTRIGPSCKLEPASLILTPPTKVRDCLFLISETDKVLHFEVASDPEGLEITPKDGVIRGGQEVIINLTCPKLPTNEKRLYKVLVYVENEVFEASVKITFIHSYPNYKKK